MGRKRSQPVVDLNALRVLSVRELCAALGIHRVTAHRWARSGVLPSPVQLGPGRIAWRARDIAAWLESRPPVVGSKPATA